MEKNLITYSNSIAATIFAGAYTVSSSPVLGTSLSKFFVVKCFASLRLTDTNLQNIKGKCTFSFRTSNSGNSYSTLIPGLTTGYSSFIPVSIETFIYFECAFIIQPGDNTRIVSTYFLDAIAATNVSCSLDVNLVGYTID